MRRYLSKEEARKLRTCFAGLWALDEEGAEEVIERAIAEPDKFVLKPQREGGGKSTYCQVTLSCGAWQWYVLGGSRSHHLVKLHAGNNLFGDELRAKLVELKNTTGGNRLAAAYILMQRIVPPVHMTYLVRRGAWSKYETVSEVGIYGTYLR